MGGKAVPTHPDYLTRVQAAQEITKALTGNPNDKLGDVVYRRIGEYEKSGELKSEPVASGRTKQFHKDDLKSFAMQVFEVEVDTFETTSKEANILGQENYTQEPFKHPSNESEINDNSALLTDIRSIIHLHDRNLLDGPKAYSMIKQIVLKSISEEEL
ncbi:hypothetical protein FZD47_18055 [Bacillus infantis]|uniref:Uncharacterized protein n=1 Tax=Bacillus infantis TaxID=324767 RepID=A0A5D4SIR2_9BACI|nr:hypothetical protein [Bacillus infantis]TYS61992.1 hypothetical protein FZD47_18055 [Bacillus infantis]